MSEVSFTYLELTQKYVIFRFTLVYNPILALAFVAVYWAIGLFHAYSI